MSSRRSPFVRSLPPLRSAAILLAMLALAACGTSSSGDKITTPSGAGGVYKVGKPYQIAGNWYYPKEDEHYDHTGIASWYGPQFHGKKTANGETFDQNQLTAAHPTLPMPVLVRVTNLENGRSIVVRVNDRGPFVAGREIDLSRKGAELLGYLKQGTARVRVQYLGRAPMPGGGGSTQYAQETFTLPKANMDESEKRVSGTTVKTAAVTATALAAPAGVKVAADSAGSATSGVASMAPIADTGPATMKPIPDNAPVGISPDAADASEVQHVAVPPTTSIYVQAGAFRNISNAEIVQRKLVAQGVNNVSVQPTVVEGTKFYRVRVGPLSDVPAADASLKTITDAGNAGARIIIE